MTNSPLTIVLPTYNGERYLTPALESVLSQTYQDWLLYVVDDGSTDLTPEIAQSYADKDHRIKLYRFENQRVPHAENWNRALRLAQTEFVSIFHQDDVMQPTMLEREIEMMRRHPDVIWVSAQGPIIDEFGLFQYHEDGRMKWKPDNANPADNWFEDHIFDGHKISALLIERIFFHASTVMLRREQALSIPLFQSHYQLLFDAEYFSRVSELGRVGYLTGELIHYRHHGTSGMARTYRLGLNGIEGKWLIEEYIARQGSTLQNKDEIRYYSLKHGNMAFKLARRFLSLGEPGIALMQLKIACWFYQWAEEPYTLLVSKWCAARYTGGRLTRGWLTFFSLLENFHLLPIAPQLPVNTNDYNSVSR